MVRRTKGEVERVLARIHDMRVEGYTHEEIYRELDIKPDTYYKVYITKLNIHWQKVWEQKTKDDIYPILEMMSKRLHDCYANAREKAREPKAMPLWGQLEQEMAMILNKFETQGLVAVLDGRFRQIEQKIRQNIGNEQPILINKQQQAGQSSDDNRGGTISESSQSVSESGSEPDSERFEDTQRQF